MLLRSILSVPISSSRLILRTVKSPTRYYSDLTSLKINATRLNSRIHETCQWGAAHRYGPLETETGMSRLSLSDADKQVRDWLRTSLSSLSATTKVDEIGNMFSILPHSSSSTKPPIMLGSHLDTQPSGGRYDGILGVLSALEVLQTLHENQVQTYNPIGLVNWTNEEGARFPISMVASGVWAGAIPLQKAWDLKEVAGNGRTMKQELQRIGYLGDVEASYKSNPMKAHFELHIEQGPMLESGGKKAGVVKGVQGYRWFTVTVRGREAHTGATPFEGRADALLAAAKMITTSNVIAKHHKGLASTGILNLTPGSTNTVPGLVTFSLDLRHPDSAVVQEIETGCRNAFQDIARSEEKGCEVEWRLDSDSPAMKFDDGCITAVKEAAEEVVGVEKVLKIESGAGHDSVYAARRCPTAMIFVPCREGVSHNPLEYCSPEDCANGAQVLLQSVLRYDQMVAN